LPEGVTVEPDTKVDNVANGLELATVLELTLPTLFVAITVNVQGPEPVTEIVPPEVIVAGPTGAPPPDEVYW